MTFLEELANFYILDPEKHKNLTKVIIELLKTYSVEDRQQINENPDAFKDSVLEALLMIASQGKI